MKKIYMKHVCIVFIACTVLFFQEYKAYEQVCSQYAKLLALFPAAAALLQEHNITEQDVNSGTHFGIYKAIKAASFRSHGDIIQLLGKQDGSIKFTANPIIYQSE